MKPGCETNHRGRILLGFYWGDGTVVILWSFIAFVCKARCSYHFPGYGSGAAAVLGSSFFIVCFLFSYFLSRYFFVLFNFLSCIGIKLESDMVPICSKYDVIFYFEFIFTCWSSKNISSGIGYLFLSLNNEISKLPNRIFLSIETFTKIQLSVFL